MRVHAKALRTITGALLSLILAVGPAFTQSAAGSLRGQVTDPFGAVVVGASVVLVGAGGERKEATTNAEGRYAVSGLAPGRHTLSVTANNFTPYENAEVEIAAQGQTTLDVALTVALTAAEEVTVTEGAVGNTAPEGNANAIVLRGKDLDALPDDPEELAAVLDALTGASAGPGGSQVFIDGFTGGRNLPPKAGISEIVINQNPYTAEYDRLGFNRIDIRLTPAADAFRVESEFFFNHQGLNARNPFADRRAPTQARYFFGSLSGPLIDKRASFFAAFQRRETDDNAIVNARVLDPNFNVVSFGESVPTAHRVLYTDFRVNYALNKNNSLVVNYQYIPVSATNVGVGDLTLASRGFSVSNKEQNVRVSNTMIVSPTVVNQTRFQFMHLATEQEGNTFEPTVRVLEAFNGGGSGVNLSETGTTRWEAHNYTTVALGGNTLRFGGRVRGVSIDDVSPANFNGAYLFAGGPGPRLDANNQPVLGDDDRPIVDQLSSIERYRRTLLFQQQGLTPAAIRALGGGASQFSIVAGDPAASVSQTDLGVFAQYDWRVRPSFTLGLGLRYETQNNISSPLNFAPRLSFAWAPGGGNKPKTVIRGGFGVFYDRFAENLTLQADRFNGLNQQQFIVSNPAILDLFPGVPTIETLQNTASLQTVRRVADDLQSPYNYQTSVSVERQLPYNFALTVTYLNARYFHMLRSRNVNAPLPGTFDPEVPDSGVRPLGNVGNVYQYESSGRLDQNQLIVTANSRLNPRLSIFANYILNKVNSNTDGPGSFPVNSYDLTGEYGRSSLDVRHRFSIGGTIEGPWGLTLNPFVTMRSGLPFNITTGSDLNGDTLFAERPTFATDLSRPGVVVTPFGAFDPNPGPGQELVPVNYGNGPAFFNTNLRLTKSFTFGQSILPALNSAGGVEKKDRPYRLSFVVTAQNLFNTVNPGVPIGNLGSPLFGQSVSNSTEAGASRVSSNRRINFAIRFNF
jgi:Carboxypeptidase regulatory-like domain